MARRLGPYAVSPLGYGAWPLSAQASAGAPQLPAVRPTEAQAVAMIHRALDLGVTLIDTADAYCIDDTEYHHNEKLIRKALDQVRLQYCTLCLLRPHPKSCLHPGLSLPCCP